MNTTRPFRALIFTSVGLVLAGTTTASELTSRSITVRYGDLRIENEQGATQLVRRIERAARRLCEPLEYGSLASPVRAWACRREATAGAIAKVDHPMVQAVYARIAPDLSLPRSAGALVKSR